MELANARAQDTANIRLHLQRQARCAERRNTGGASCALVPAILSTNWTERPVARMSGFPPTFSKSAVSAGARGGSRTEGDGSCPGSPSPRPTQPATTAVQPDPNLAEVQQLRARIADGGREKSSARNVRDPSPSLHRHARGVGAKRGSLLASGSALMATLIDQGGTLASSVQPIGLKGHVSLR